MKIPLDDTRDRKVKMLTELNNRECLARIDFNDKLLPAFKCFTLNYKSIPRIKREIIKDNNDDVDNNLIGNLNNNFCLNSNVNLKTVLISNSTSRKVVK